MSSPPKIVQFRPAIGAEATTNNACIVFVHGFGGRAATTWGKFPDLIMADPYLNHWDVYSIGYTTNLSIDVPGVWAADPSISILSNYLSEVLKDGLPNSRYSAVTLVAHSMGGLVVQRALVDDSSLASRTTHVFLYGTPSNGLLKARLVQFLKPQLRDMARDSEFIVNLRSRWEDKFGSQNAQFTIRTTGGDSDQFVPPESSLKPFPEDTRRVVEGNHLSIVKPESAKSLSFQLLRSGLVPEKVGGVIDSAALAIEQNEFHELVRRLEPQKGELDEGGLVSLALALEAIGREGEALAVLQQYTRGSMLDATGTLAGRLKRRWLVGRRRSDAEEAMKLYRAAYEIACRTNDEVREHYAGINLAFMELAYGGDIDEARNLASVVLHRIEEMPRNSKDQRWRHASMGEACLILGDIQQAREHYINAVAHTKSPRELDSIYQQGILTAGFMGDLDAAYSIAIIFGREPA